MSRAAAAAPIWGILLCVALLGAACSAAPEPAAQAMPAAPDPEVHLTQSGADLPDALSGPPEIAGAWLIQAERHAAHQGNLDQLALLWAPNSRVIDRRGYGTPVSGAHATQQEGRFYIWEGKDAVLNRYVVAVFPHAPPLLEPGALDAIEFHPGRSTGDYGERDYGEGDTVGIINRHDRWKLIRRENRWWLLELSYTSR